MKLKNFFKPDKPKPRPLVAVLGNQNINNLGEGKLNVNSMTWAFIHSWATKELKKAREDNDRPSRDQLQTEAIRGRIKLLKEIINLPAEEKAAIVDDYEGPDRDTYAGYG